MAVGDFQNISSRRPWYLILSAVGVFFLAASGILIHDSLDLSESATENEIRELVLNARPVLFDLVGQPIPLHQDQDYERVLMQGSFRARPGATIAMISPRNRAALVDVAEAPMAMLQGWSVEPLTHELGRVIQQKQTQGMWLGNSPDLWFQYTLFWMSVILLFGALFMASEANLRPSSAQIQTISL